MLKGKATELREFFGPQIDFEIAMINAIHIECPGLQIRDYKMHLDIHQQTFSVKIPKQTTIPKLVPKDLRFTSITSKIH